jgi:hypothetical protein
MRRATPSLCCELCQVVSDTALNAMQRGIGGIGMQQLMLCSCYNVKGTAVKFQDPELYSWDLQVDGCCSNV